jgi:LytS/YehU family sensor histidine kinase
MIFRRNYFVILQVIVWVVSFILFLFYLQQRLVDYQFIYVFGVAFSSFTSFATIIYGYIFYYHQFYRKDKLLSFTGGGILLFAAIVLLRVVWENQLVAPLAEDRSSIFSGGRVHWAYTIISCFFALIVSILAKSFKDVVTLRTRQAEIQKKHLETELRQLKAHVQPHFLFNSLNNLYYDTYKALPDVAERIAKLSDIMRYFMEESPKEFVSIASEIHFIEDYIDLEKIRLHSPIELNIRNNANGNQRIPPMLLIPLVENAFKHGVQNNGTITKVEIALTQTSKQLHFQIKNSVSPIASEKKRAGTGLKNLEDRLSLLYADKYSFETNTANGFFIANMIIPLDEN